MRRRSDDSDLERNVVSIREPLKVRRGVARAADIAPLPFDEGAAVEKGCGGLNETSYCFPERPPPGLPAMPSTSRLASPRPRGRVWVLHHQHHQHQHYYYRDIALLHHAARPGTIPAFCFCLSAAAEDRWMPLQCRCACLFSWPAVSTRATCALFVEVSCGAGGCRYREVLRPTCACERVWRYWLILCSRPTYIRERNYHTLSSSL